MMIEIVLVDGERLAIGGMDVDGDGVITEDQVIEYIGEAIKDEVGYLAGWSGDTYRVVPTRHIRYVQCHGVEVSRE